MTSLCFFRYFFVIVFSHKIQIFFNKREQILNENLNFYATILTVSRNSRTKTEHLKGPLLLQKLSVVKELKLTVNKFLQFILELQISTR